MPSEKLTRILYAGGLTLEHIVSLTDAQGWAIVYGRQRVNTGQLTVCFTGFSDLEKEELRILASRAGMKPVTGVNGTLFVLCTGENPGPSKLAKARAIDCHILTREEFEQMLQTGELPV